MRWHIYYSVIVLSSPRMPLPHASTSTRCRPISPFALSQARLAAHRALLCHCLSLVSSSLGKQELKAGMTVEDVAAAVRSAYLAAPHERLGEIQVVEGLDHGIVLRIMLSLLEIFGLSGLVCC